jgi:hypothetical protein
MIIMVLTHGVHSSIFLATQESEVRSQESGTRNQEPGAR